MKNKTSIIKKFAFKNPDIVSDIFGQSLFNNINRQVLDDTKHFYNIKDYDNTMAIRGNSMQGRPTKTTKGDISFHKTHNVVNTNSPRTDFPALQGMPVPDPSNNLHISTGNGRGGELFARSQVKVANILGVGEERETGRVSMLDETIPQFYDPYKEKTENTKNLANILKWFNPLFYTNKLTSSAKSGALAGLTIGSLAGIPPTLLLNYLRRKPSSHRTAAIVGAGAGAALLGAYGFLMGRDKRNYALAQSALNKYSSHNKKAFGITPNNDVKQIITSKIMSDMSLDFNQKNALVNYVNNLTPQAASQLSPLTKGIIGSGIGAAVANLLLGMGYTGTILFSVLGGIIGGSMSNSPQPQNNFLAGYGFRDVNGNLI